MKSKANKPSRGSTNKNYSPKVAVLIGGRPQIVKAASLIRPIKSRFTNCLVIDSGQHYSKKLSTDLYKDFSIPKQDYTIRSRSKNTNEQIFIMQTELEKILVKEKIDCLIVFGDMNTTLAGAMAAKNTNTKLAHVEAGIRSGNINIIEERNRIITDHLSDILFAPDLKSVKNLKTEGLRNKRGRFVINSGDLMLESLLDNIKTLPAKSKNKTFDLLTIHRAESTKDVNKLMDLIDFVIKNSSAEEIIFSVHPRTQSLLRKRKLDNRIKISEPLKYRQMLALCRDCQMVFTDSGGLQREACWIGKPCIILKSEAEWPNLIKQRRSILYSDFRSKFKFKLKQEKLKIRPSEIIVNQLASLL